MSAAFDQTLFGDALALDEHLPLAFEPGRPRSTVAHHHSALLLRALAVIEQTPPSETDSGVAQAAELSRIEAKVDLLLALAASFAATRSGTLAETSIRWSRLGARVRLPAVPSSDHGVLTVYIDPRLPQPVALPVRVLGAEIDQTEFFVWLHFCDLDHELEAALERCLFRRHRRAVAEARRATKP